MTDEQPPTNAAERDLYVINETMRRTHYVMAKFCETLERTTAGDGTGLLSREDTMSVLKGAVSGAAAFAARIQFERNPAVATKQSPEEYLGDALRDQFVGVFREVAAQDALQAKAAAGTEPS